MPEPQRRRRSLACHAGTGERLLRVVIAVLLAAFSVTGFPDQPIIAVAAGVLAVGVVVMAVTGSCPASWAQALAARQAASAQAFEYVDARDLVDITARTDQKETNS